MIRRQGQEGGAKYRIGPSSKDLDLAFLPLDGEPQPRALGPVYPISLH